VFGQGWWEWELVKTVMGRWVGSTWTMTVLVGMFIYGLGL
jgi:hypothetical protein